MHFIKLSDRAGGDPMHRIHELKLETLADIREAIAYMQMELQKANREGRELILELWSNYREPQPRLEREVMTH